MIVSIEAPEYVKQWLLNYQHIKTNSTENYFTIDHKSHLARMISLYFRRPKGDEMMMETKNGLLIKLSPQMKREMKIYISKRQSQELVETIRKAMFENFLVECKMKVAEGLSDRNTIYQWLEENHIDCDTKTFNMFEKRFYRYMPVNIEKSRKNKFTTEMSEHVRSCPKR